MIFKFLLPILLIERKTKYFESNEDSRTMHFSCVLVSPREIFARVSEPRGKEGGGGGKEERRERVGVKFSLNEKKCDTRGAKVNQAEKPHCPSDGCSTLLTVWRSLTWKRVTSEQFEFSHRKRNKKYQSRHRYLWFSILRFVRLLRLPRTMVCDIERIN